MFIYNYNSDVPASLLGHNDDRRDTDVSFSGGFRVRYHRYVRQYFISLFYHSLSAGDSEEPPTYSKMGMTTSRSYSGTHPRATVLK